MPLSITDIPLRQLPSLVCKLGIKPYAAGQIISWLYKKRVTSFDEMTNLALDARHNLVSKYSIGKLKVEKVFEAEDGTKKFLFELIDGRKIESVLIPVTDKRLTLCVSTQVGCAMGCLFCRTACMGFVRDLTQGEILGQLLEVQRLEESTAGAITNVVFMGMGEPFANYLAVTDAVEIMLNERAFNFSKRRITISSSGLVPQLEQFSRQFDVKLAISLNATDDETRGKLMPINRRYPMADIMSFCCEYTKRSKHRMTFEYVMFRGINDTKDDMKRLVKLLEGISAKVNLIPFNPFPGSAFDTPLEEVVEDWFNFLTKKGIQTNIRASRGQGILAACGQLAV